VAEKPSKKEVHRYLQVQVNLQLRRNNLQNKKVQEAHEEIPKIMFSVWFAGVRGLLLFAVLCMPPNEVRPNSICIVKVLGSVRMH
jgi:hypothetical protein